MLLEIKNFLLNIAASVVASFIFAGILLFYKVPLVQIRTYSAILLLGAVIGGFVARYWYEHRIRVFPHGTEVNGQRILKSQNLIKILMLIFGEDTDNFPSVEEAVRCGQSIEFLILNPTPSNLDQLTRIKRIDLKDAQSKLEKLKQLRDKSPKDSSDKHSVRLFLYDSTPLCGCVITDNHVHYYPFVFRNHEQGFPTFQVQRNGQLGEFIERHYEQVKSTAIEV